MKIDANGDLTIDAAHGLTGEWRQGISIVLSQTRDLGETHSIVLTYDEAKQLREWLNGINFEAGPQDD